jgi:MinD-like ATPase involved in chromosome partitioning or flagellar assembly
MVTFDTAITVAKQTIKNWSEYAGLSEVTIIRDVFGKLSFWFSGTGNLDQSGLKAALHQQLGSYDAQRIFWAGRACNDLTKELLQEVKTRRHPDGSDGGCAWYLLERTIAKKAWLSYNGQVAPIWPYEDAVSGRQPKIVTFYSFKGGMGRTTALAATALLLAQHGRHVLAIDTDIEAPGLATLFFDENKIQRGTVDFYLELSASGRGTIDMAPYLKQVDDPKLTEGMTGSIYIIPAGNVDEHYVQKLGRIDYQDIVETGMSNHLSCLIENAVNFIHNGGYPLEYILLDARAGFHDMGGVVTAHLPHGAVLFGKNNTQSWNGLRQVIQALAYTQRDPLPAAIVASMSGNSEGQRQAFKSQAYTLCCENYYLAFEDDFPGIDAEDVAHTPIYIPYASELSEDVRLYSNGSETQDRAVARARSILCSGDYGKIEDRIRQWFGDDQQGEEVLRYGGQ